MIPRSAIGRCLISVVLTTSAWTVFAQSTSNPENRPGSEVLIEARVLEVNSQTLRQFGVRAAPAPGNAPSRLGFGMSVSEDLARSLMVGPGSRLVQSLRVTSTLGKVTQIRIGSRVPATAGSGSEAGESFDAGIDFNISPSISPSQVPSMKMAAQVKIRREDSRGSMQTVFTGQSIQREIAVARGQSIVVGGFLRDAEVVSLARMAFLRNSPLFGYLFAQEREPNQRSEIVVLLVPTIEGPVDPRPPVARAPDLVLNAKAEPASLDRATASPTGYSVQVGAFQNEAAAQSLQRSLSRRYTDVVVQNPSADHLYRVRVGRLANLSLAKKVEKALRIEGFKPMIVHLD